jgi:hypothetical protein
MIRDDSINNHHHGQAVSRFPELHHLLGEVIRGSSSVLAFSSRPSALMFRRLAWWQGHHWPSMSSPRVWASKMTGHPETDDSPSFHPQTRLSSSLSHGVRIWFNIGRPCRLPEYNACSSKPVREYRRSLPYQLAARLVSARLSSCPGLGSGGVTNYQRGLAQPLAIYPGIPQACTTLVGSLAVRPCHLGPSTTHD